MKYILYVHVYICSFIASILCDKCFTRINKLLLYCIVLYCMLIFHKGHTDTIQVYSVTVMTHVNALQAGHSSQGTSEPITPALSDMNPAFGLQLHHPRFLAFIGAPESARLLYHSPSFWLDRLGVERSMVAAVNLQRDAGLMLSNLQILSQFVTSLHRMSSEMMSIGIGRVVFPAAEIADLFSAPRAPRAAKYMAAMGLWRPQTGPGDPGPVPVY